MDDRRFDALVKSLAAGRNRRSVLKGLLGLGGVAAGGALLENDTQAARRPTPTPKPKPCPYPKVLVGGVCTCPGSAPHPCGPDCCTEDSVPAPLPGHSECCDNACCFGTCYGEELCCPTNHRGSVGQLPPTHKLCEGPNGPHCCEWDEHCCLEDGCCDTLCYGGMVGDSFCCLPERVCHGATSEGDICCFEGETCCNDGTDANRCVNLANDECCTTADCTEGGTLCRNCTEDYVCSTTACSEGTVCCPTVDGPNACQPGDCCPDGRGCDAGQVCCGEGADAQCAESCGSPACRQCDAQGLDCCFINDVFAGCWDSSNPNACCTAATCEEYNDFENCVVGACIDFMCEARGCSDTQFCCDGSCSDVECVGSTQCTDDSDCGGNIVCCGGTCCTTGQSCITDPDGNTYCD